MSRRSSTRPAAPRAAGAAPRSSLDSAAATSPLPSSLLKALQQLPAAAEGLLGKPSRRGRVEFPSTLLDGLCALPYNSPPNAAALAELLSTHPDSAKALLRLHAAALREDGEAEGAAGGGSGSSGSGSGDGASALAGPAGADLRALIFRSTLLLIYHCTPLPASRHARSVLRLVRAMLRSQMLHVLSRRLAAAASLLDGAGGSGTDHARETLVITILHLTNIARTVLLCDTAFAGVLFPKAGAGAPTHINPPPELAAEVAAERAAGVEELARGLAESGVLEHAARVLLLLQARGPQAVRPREEGVDSLAVQVLGLFFSVAWYGADDGTGLLYAAMEPAEVVAGCPNCATPAAAAQFRKALSGRCVQTAVLVYSVGTLRLVDRGPTYGLPAALQTAGLATCEPGTREPDPTAIGLLLLQLASRSALSPAGPGASLELALRVGRAAVGTLAGCAAMEDGSASARPPITLAVRPAGAVVRFILAALRCGRRFLPAADVTPAQAQGRAEWWRLAKWPLVCGIHLDGSGTPGHPHQELYDIMVEHVHIAWPDGCMDLDALPPEPPAELAAALAGGLLSALASLPELAAASPEALGAISNGLLAACDRSPPDGTGFTLFLVPLLAYGSTEECEGALEAVRLLAGYLQPSDVLCWRDQRAAFEAALDLERTVSMRCAAESFLAFTHAGLQRRQDVAGAAGAGAQSGAAAGCASADAASSSTAAAGSALPRADPLRQLRGMVTAASELWGLPLL
ncbi:hypothetical protein HYH03_009481 [Edaphochlamys debaryana]|uniref:Uncharacterized protein n=1 Tax=Edaphochlamys debaryana TaxID=47281 RepID=A0A836BXS3_9CHLO|nr:hypothetical protein HYH03_009481 [Edaphochlamys debaryana]|eukprot:KAG2492237.1 hypothetical protein HYH03_009481 [Edaphochlamys debaryana]